MNTKGATYTAWNKKEEKLRARYPDLTEEDLIYEKGNEKQLIRNIQQKLGKSRYEVKQVIKSV
jgi:hypothetical protein